MITLISSTPRSLIQILIITLITLLYTTTYNINIKYGVTADATATTDTTNTRSLRQQRATSIPNKQPQKKNASTSDQEQQQTETRTTSTTTTTNNTSTMKMPPNIVVFLVDDMGWNQVGYHANNVGNDEIRTPNIDYYATKVGIEINRGYMTPWCGPSRAAIITGRTNVYNFNISSLISTYDDNIGYVSGVQPGTKTLATALKEYGQSINTPYTTWFNGKFGIGGTAFTNTPLGMGFDEFRGFWGTGLDACDGLATPIGTVGTETPLPFNDGFGSNLITVLPGYFEQHPQFPDVDWCPFIESVSSDILTDEEKFIACKTRPRTLPKLLDLDLLDKVVEQITTHNYTKGPMLQYFSTALLHQPITYPMEYDINASDVLPDYFQPGKVKPRPTNDDYRMTINQAVRYLDDIFGSTMQAIKDAGQWNNTIVYFTSDNGGPIYSAAAMNNYPLRSTKFTPFEGGVRVNQFMTGGWLNLNLPKNRRYKSNTNIFPNDIAPTLLEMVGADVSLLLDGKKGATYGNPMWKYIQNSIEVPANNSTTTTKKPQQMIRKVSISNELFFDVQENRTMKHIYTGMVPLFTPRLWEPIWPKNGDLLMDPNYRSVKPCRPNGIALDCCLMDVTNDFQEKNPLPTDCATMEIEGKQLFEIEGGCNKDENGMYNSVMCLQPGEVSASVLPSKLSLWSHIGAAGPFTNSKGVPIDGLPMACVCESFAENVGSMNDVSYFTLTALTPTQCNNKNGLLNRRPAQSVSCSGLPLSAYNQENSTQRKSRIYDELINSGVDRNSLEIIARAERRQAIFATLPALYRSLNSVLNREGFTEWPNILKWPYFYKDTCGMKNASSLAYPNTTFPPYVLGGETELTYPKSRGPLELCAIFTPDNKFFCPSHQNPMLANVEYWNYDRLNPRGYFTNGSVWEPLGLFECLTKCPVRPEGTAYIGDGPHGIII